MKNGKWVVVDGRVGIHVHTKVVSSEVHLTNEKGETVQVIIVHPAAMREATFDEIPASRRPTIQQAALLGIPGTVETAEQRRSLRD